jgi:hypothetical protein
VNQGRVEEELGPARHGRVQRPLSRAPRGDHATAGCVDRSV